MTKDHDATSMERLIAIGLKPVRIEGQDSLKIEGDEILRVAIGPHYVEGFWTLAVELKNENAFFVDLRLRSIETS